MFILHESLSWAQLNPSHSRTCSCISFLAGKSPSLFVPPSCSNQASIGSQCNVPTSPCDLFRPCANNGTCSNTAKTARGYICSCPAHFNGTECQFNNRPCQTSSCWNAGEAFYDQEPSFPPLIYLQVRAARRPRRPSLASVRLAGTACIVN